MVDVEKVTADDCRSCGACCIGGYADHSSADCTVDDVRRMSRRVRSRLLTRNLRDGVSLGEDGVTPTDDLGYCSFLRGTPGQRVSCRIYTTRPAICREYRPGSQRCRDARKELFSA